MADREITKYKMCIIVGKQLLFGDYMVLKKAHALLTEVCIPIIGDGAILAIL